MSSTTALPGSPRHPDTPGGYCLARCYCQTCPAYVWADVWPSCPVPGAAQREARRVADQLGTRSWSRRYREASEQLDG